MSRRAALAALAALGIVACGRGPRLDAGPAAATSVAVAPASAAPVDRLAPDELLEGPELAFGLPLPRALHIERQNAGTVRALGPVSVHALAKYVAARVGQGAHFEEGDTFALLEHVALPGKAGAEFRVRLTALPPQGTLLEVDDVTRKPAADLPDEAARWKQVGLTPEGKIPDPSHLE